MATFQWDAGAIQTLMSTELNSLAGGSSAIASTGYDPVANGYTHGTFELNVTFGTNPTAENTVDLYLIPAPDGSNYDSNTTGASPSQPATAYAGGFPVKAVTTAQKIPLGIGQSGKVELPPCIFKAYLKNGAGQAFPASASTLKMVPFRMKSV
jgi:hypothetical protein